MSCVICDKYSGTYGIDPIAEIEGVTISHIMATPENPAHFGRLMIEPKRHVTKAEELTMSESSSMGLLIQRGIILLERELGAEHVYFFRINDQVTHFHFHLLPRYKNTPKDYWGLKILEWNDYPRIHQDEVKTLSERLSKAW